MVTQEEYDKFVDEYNRTHKTNHSVSPDRKLRMMEQAARQQRNEPSEARLRAERDAAYYRMVENHDMTGPSEARLRAERDAAYYRMVEDNDRMHPLNWDGSPAYPTRSPSPERTEQRTSPKKTALTPPKRTEQRTAPEEETSEKTGRKHSLKDTLDRRSLLGALRSRGNHK